MTSARTLREPLEHFYREFDYTRGSNSTPSGFLSATPIRAIASSSGSSPRVSRTAAWISSGASSTESSR